MTASVRSRWNGERVLLQYELLPSPWERLSARLVDQGLTGLVAAITLLFGLMTESVPLFAVGLVVWFVGQPIYEIVFTAASGQTIGKKIKGIRVVNVSDGRTPSLARSIVRCVVLLGAFWAWYSVLWGNRNHRGPHDRLSRTLVVYADDERLERV